MRTSLGASFAFTALTILLGSSSLTNLAKADDAPQAVAEDAPSAESATEQPQVMATDAAQATDASEAPAAEDPALDAAIRAGAEQVRRSLGGSVVDDAFPQPPTTYLVRPAAPTSPGYPQYVAPQAPPTLLGPQYLYPPPSLQQPAIPQSPYVSAPPYAPYAPESSPGASMADARRIAALRSAAAELDASANRLESVELYDQSDALRKSAQRLRTDARRLSGGHAATPGLAGNRPHED